MIYICDDINTDYPYEELERFVSIERKVKALKYVQRLDYSLSLLAYCLLKAGIYKETGIVLADYTTFVCTGSNKPHIDGINKCFNISHCAKCVAIAISDSDIGIDVESEKNVTTNLINFTMSSNEIAKIKSDKNYFYRFWTNKESYLKLLGSGINILLTKLDFSEFSKEVFDFKNIHFYTNRNNNYSLTVCSKDECFNEESVVKFSFRELLTFMEEIQQ